MKTAWELGCRDATKMAKEDGMKPVGRTVPQWWSTPKTNDPRLAKSTEGGRGEEDLKEDSTSDEEEDEGDSDSPSGDSEGEDDEFTQFSILYDAIDVPVTFVEPAKLKLLKIQVPGRGEQYKKHVIEQFNDGRTNMSADRGLRVTQGRPDYNQVSPAFDAANDEWMMGIGTDIAVFYDSGNVWMGQVIRMRKCVRSGRRHTEYKHPVVIDEDRTPLGDLQVQLFWYQRAHGGGRTEKRFKLKLGDFNEIHVEIVICPITMTYNKKGGYYVLDPGTDKAIQAQKKGNVQWNLQ
jgi:hypothetical protein